jgi:hypothetical protein
MMSSRTANLARATAIAAIASISLLIGTPELAKLLGLGATVALPLLLSDRLIENILEMLKEPAKSLAGDGAVGLVDMIANKFTEQAGGLDEQLRLAVARATNEAIRDLHYAYRQGEYYRSLARTNPEATAQIDHLFETLLAETQDPQFLQRAVKEITEVGKIHHLIIGGSKQVEGVLTNEVAAYFEGHDTHVVEFLQQRLVSNVVTQLAKLLSEDTREGAQASRAFTLLRLAYLDSYISNLEQGQRQLLYGQSIMQDRLKDVDDRVQAIRHLLSSPTGELSPALAT